MMCEWSGKAGERYYCLRISVKGEDVYVVMKRGIYPYDWILSLVYWKVEVVFFSSSSLFVGDGIGSK